MSQPVFFDPSGRRRAWSRWGGIAVLVALLGAITVFASTIVSVPVPAPLELPVEHPRPLPFRAQINQLSRNVRQWLPDGRASAAPTPGERPITIAFYADWADESAPSLAKHLDQVDWVAPTLLALDPAGQLIEMQDARLRHLVQTAARRPLVVPVVQNAIEGKFDGRATAALLADASRRQSLVRSLVAYLDRTGDAGIVFDFEDLPASSLGNLHRLLEETRAAFAPRQRIVSLTVPLGDPAWKPREFADVTDRIVLMAYDQHWAGGTPGPIAANDWFARQLAPMLKGLEPGKAVVALGSYGYDWHDHTADSLTIEEAWLAARDSDEKPVYDPVSGNTGFSFDEDGHRHDVWMLDAAASWNQMRLLTRLGVSNVALWRLGSEDPGFWPALSAWRAGGRPDLSRIDQVGNVDVEGRGEILDITATPSPGRRAVQFDATRDDVVAENYVTLPTPYVVERSGARPREVALSFDDGPDPHWTPRILSILEKYHVPGSFFIVGENGLTQGALLRRMVADGDEIGNHSYTHPNMAEESDRGIGLEINATTRLIEAETGRSTRLFRAPYFGDAEPTTTDELKPALIARQLGYTVAGLHVDPGDWKRPGVQTIVDQTLRQVAAASPERSANIILLHDGGGDRAQTVAALPRIIMGLQQAGYRFVTIGELANLPHDAIMPPVTGSDLTAVRADIGLFAALATAVVVLNWTFFCAIALGVLRAVTMALLALRSAARRRTPPELPIGERSRVTVIIPAYNEERVIEASVGRVLASDYPALEVIVADDGSRDRTSAIVTAAYGDDPRVRLLTLTNGGKASALNRALAQSRGDIVVALDADTQFEPETISRLVRWFADPTIGAVAGNAKVGNRINLVTRWQAVEYVTAQNLERRALTGFDAITVVPGAVGAWRRKALDDVGGYPENTLAEDQDLTIAIQRRGWRVAYDEDAIAWTEAPETFRALAKQRFRWSFGTLQCLWKHRAGLFDAKRPVLGFVALPQIWLFQILLTVVAPLVDLAVVWSLAAGLYGLVSHPVEWSADDILRPLLYWAAFILLDLSAGVLGMALERKAPWADLAWLPAQRFGYRQLMYYVVLKSVASAIQGARVGWGRLERRGTVAMGRVG